jgi:hypothetical protein
MGTKLITMIVVVALVLAATATICTQPVLAVDLQSRQHISHFSGINPGSTTDGQPEHGLANACSHAHHSPPCGVQTTAGDNGGIKS